MDNNEKEIVMRFEKMRIPVMFKTDLTDRILFLEDINFIIRNVLLKNKIISDILYYETMSDYERFINNTDVKEFDDYTLDYFNMCVEIVQIIKKCYLY